MHTLRTDLTLSFAGYEVTLPLVVTYWHRKAFNGGRSEPSSPEHVEIGLVSVMKDGTPEKLPEFLIEAMTPNLERVCLEEWTADDEREAETMFDTRREERAAMRRPQAAE